MFTFHELGVIFPIFPFLPFIFSHSLTFLQKIQYSFIRNINLSKLLCFIGGTNRIAQFPRDLRNWRPFSLCPLFTAVISSKLPVLLLPASFSSSISRFSGNSLLGLDQIRRISAFLCQTDELSCSRSVSFSNLIAFRRPFSP